MDINIEIKTVNPAQPETVEKIASVYKQTFGSSPWNEGFKCPTCEKIFPLAFLEENCPACASKGSLVSLKEYWPMEKVISDFSAEMAKPKSLCLAALIDGEIIGFAWGYEIVIDPSIDQHLEAPGLHELAKGIYFYLDEAAILPPYQGKGIGKELIRRIFLEQNQSNILLRTLNGSRMYQIIQKMEGKPALIISRDRVIMTLDLSLIQKSSCQQF